MESLDGLTMEVTMKTVKEIDEAIGTLKNQVQSWELDVAQKRADLKGLEVEKAGHRRRALRDKDAGALGNLDAVRSVTIWLVQEVEDFEVEIQKATQEIQELTLERIEAARVEAWDKWLAESKEAVKEAQAIEKYLDGFIAVLTPHRDRLARMSQLAKDAGSERPTFDMRHLWRRFTGRLHKYDPWAGWGKVDKVYEGGYPAVLKHIFDIADQQQNPTKKAANG
jgi:hypothetical protein